MRGDRSRSARGRLHPSPAIKFALDGENGLLLRVWEGPKQKRRTDGRSGDKPEAVFAVVDVIAGVVRA